MPTLNRLAEQRPALGDRVSGIHWLSAAFGEGFRVTVDADRVDALAADRSALWSRVTAAPFLTVNEKRAMVGFSAIEGGDRFE